jgi:flagellin-specific chaperone FliS
MERSRAIPIAPESPISALRNLSPSERLLGLYAYCIEGCTQRNREQVTAVLEELISILDFGSGEIAEGFYRLYAFCLRKAREGQFDSVVWILRDLHDTWAQALNDLPADAAPPFISGPAQAG